MNSTRRSFIKNAAMLAAGTVLPVDAISRVGGRIAANDKIQVALIGANGMGYNNLASFLKNPEIACVAMCDVDKNVLEKRIGNLAETGLSAPKLYGDYRKMLENKDIDAVIIGTPDHWHCMQFVDSLASGKHVYVEKPLGNSIAEINIMQKAANRYGKMVQVGQWQRSQPHFVDAINFLKTGALGRIRTCKAWSYVDWKGPVPKVPDTPVPEGVDYDMWLGPAPKRPFNKNRFHFTWRWYWEYAGGLMTDWGVHLIDYILYGMGSLPVSVMATGGKYAYPEDDMVTPDTMTAVYDFRNFTMIWEHTIGIGLGNWRRPHGMAYIGENGTLVLDRNGWEVVPEKQKIEAIPLQQNVGIGLDLHVRNFIDCLKSNTPQQLNAGIDVGRQVALVAQMGNIAYRTGEKVYWDNDAQLFSTQSANRLITPDYQNGWKLPNPDHMHLEKYSFGTGDRFGKQGIAQLSAIMEINRLGVPVVPVWNKSNREHTIIGSSPDNVKVAAAAAVAVTGYSGNYYTDADHIGLETVDRFMDSCNFFTLDVAHFIGKNPLPEWTEDFIARYSKYLGPMKIHGIKQFLNVTMDFLYNLAGNYLVAVEEVARIYGHLCIVKGRGNFVTEISVDEAELVQGPLELFFILALLKEKGVEVQTIAPKFSGLFAKGVDYIGDVEGFAAEFEQDVAVIEYAKRELGLPQNLKLSVHSGSDKFSIYPAIKAAIRKFDAGIHVKTAGTTWLEEVIGLAKSSPDGLAIAREIYTRSFERYEELTSPYATVLHIDKQQLPAISEVNSWNSRQFTEALNHDRQCRSYNPHFRQLIHVGYKIAAGMGKDYLCALDKHHESIAAGVRHNLLERHLIPLFL